MFTFQVYTTHCLLVKQTPSLINPSSLAKSEKRKKCTFRSWQLIWHCFLVVCVEDERACTLIGNHFCNVETEFFWLDEAILISAMKPFICCICGCLFLFMFSCTKPKKTYAHFIIIGACFFFFLCVFAFAFACFYSIRKAIKLYS